VDPVGLLKLSKLICSSEDKSFFQMTLTWRSFRLLLFLDVGHAENFQTAEKLSFVVVQSEKERERENELISVCSVSREVMDQ